MKKHAKNKQSKDDFMKSLNLDFVKKDGKAIEADKVYVFKIGNGMVKKVIMRGEK